ncbi:hypothetical protein [Streptomyces sp. NPDC090131]|uniref:hypothetical protein n=1 Tax=Streptomyces sp. NPDC090131 TaxID=3365954 RepID=UPI0038071967
MSESLYEPWLRGVAFNPAAPSDVLIRLMQPAAGEAALLMCTGRDLPDAAFDAALRHPDRRIRQALALNRHVDASRPAPLATDPSGPAWAECWAIRLVIGHGPDCLLPITEPAPRTGPDWFAACAVSEEPVLRRVAANSSLLSADLVKALAQDDDEEVRVRLACRHPLAPPHLLLDVFVTRPDHRPHLLTLRGFPRSGLAHLIGHPDPEVRALAAADPALPVPPGDDPDESVCRAAAADPSLTPEALEALLANPRTAQGAAADPSLPASRMHALLDRCLNGAATSRSAAGHGEATPT